MTDQPARQEPDNVAPVILIVDDDPAIRLLLRQALERDSYAILEAVDGKAGLSI